MTLVSAKDVGRTIPKKFFVVMPFGTDNYSLRASKDIASGVLNGVQGISDRAEIIMQWYGMARDAVLSMDGEELVKLNNLSRVQYENPEYLVSNGMAALYRIFAKDKDTKYGPRSLADNLAGHIGGSLKEKPMVSGLAREALAIADRLVKASASLESAIEALPSDPDDRKQVLREAQLYDEDLKYLQRQLRKVEEYARSFYEYIKDGRFNKSTVELYLSYDNYDAVVRTIGEALSSSDQAISNVIDWGFDSGVVASMAKLFDAMAEVQKELNAVSVLRDKAFELLSSVSEYASIRYKAERGDLTRVLEQASVGFPSVKTVRGLAALIHKHAQSDADLKELTIPKWEKLLRMALESVARIYKSEGEWLVKDRTLRIPKGSTLWITRYPLPPEVEEKIKNGTLTELDRFSHRWAIDANERLDGLIKDLNLEQRYTVRRIDKTKFDEARSKWASRPVKGSADEPLPEDDLEAFDLWADLDVSDEEREVLKERLKQYKNFVVPLTDEVLNDVFIVDDKVVTLDDDDITIEEKNKWLDGQDRLRDKVIDALEEQFKNDFLEYPSPLYHATPYKSVASIMKNGLKPMAKTRGLSNRGVGAAIFTADDLDYISDSYGDAIFKIDVPAMKQDGVEFSVEKEPAVFEGEAMGALAHRLGIDDYYWESGDSGADDPSTVILHVSSVDPKYLSLVNRQGKVLGPTSASAVSASVLAEKNGRPKGTFLGDDDGTWEYTAGYPLGHGRDWYASIGLSSANGWKNLSVEGATEWNNGFRSALKEIVEEYPQVLDFTASFDGPSVKVSDLVASEPDLGNLVLLHGTSTAVLTSILKEGLRPRGDTGAPPAYGARQKPSREHLVYLTSQPQMARFAALAAAKVHGGEPVILEVSDIDWSKAEPDEDSREDTAEASLARLGSIGYRGTLRNVRVRGSTSASASAKTKIEKPLSAAAKVETARSAISASTKRISKKIDELKVIDYDPDFDITYVAPPHVDISPEEVPTDIKNSSLTSSSAKYAEILETKKVPLKDIVVYQEVIHKEKLHELESKSKLDPIDLVMSNDGRLYLVDGNHRFAIAILRGAKSILANIRKPADNWHNSLPRRASFSASAKNTVYHVGNLDAPRKKPHVSYEGSGLSVSLHPEEWRKIARGHVSGDTWALSKEDPKFLLANKANQKKARKWAIENGWLKPQTRYQVSWFDDEMDDTMSMTFDSMEEAKEEAESHEVEVEEIDSVALDSKGLRYWKEAFSSEPKNSLAGDFAILWYAEAKGYDGVWWNDRLDPVRLSAPRGVIFQSKLPEWSKTKVDNINPVTVAIQKYIKGHHNPEIINEGDCLDLAEYVVAEVPEAEWRHVSHYGEEDEYGAIVDEGGQKLPSHHWVEYEGKHYDAEAPDGVTNWRELPLMKRELAGSSVQSSSNTLKLYRASPDGQYDKPRSFWATASDYPSYIHPGVPVVEAELSPSAKVARLDGSPSKARLDELENSGFDAAAFPCWDWDGDEYVVFNTSVLNVPRRVKASTEAPKDFRLMFRIPTPGVSDLGEQLASGVLKGVTGITDSGKVLMLRMLGQNRNAMLIMPGQAVLDLNDLERIEYDDPDYLMANDMAVAQRIMGQSHSKESTIRRILNEAASFKSPVKDFMKRWESLDVRSVGGGYPSDQLATIPLDSAWDFAAELFALSKPKVEEAMQRNAELGEDFVQERYGPLLDPDNYLKAVKAGLLAFGKSFVWEGEWLVRNKTLRIPPGSRLFVLIEGPLAAEAKQFLAENDVGSQLTVRWVNQDKIQRAGLALGQQHAEKLVKERWKTLASKTSSETLDFLAPVPIIPAMAPKKSRRIRANTPLSFAEVKAAVAEAADKAKAEGIPLVLGGGFAMQAYGSNRLTADVDLLAPKLPSFTESGEDLILGGQFGGKSVDINGIPIDVIVRGDDYADLYQEAIRKAKPLPGYQVKVVPAEYLVAMKMVAGRPKDDLDLNYLLSSVKMDFKQLKDIVNRFLGRYAVTELVSQIQTARWMKKAGKL